MKILITGANGYIGSALVKALQDEHEVTPLTRQDCDLCNWDEVTDFFYKKSQEEIYYDLVIHTAAEGGSRLKIDEADVFYNNIKMFHHIWEYRTIAYSRLIQISSGAENRRVWNENENLKYYGFSKKIINELTRSSDITQTVKVYGLFDENELDTRFIKSNIKRYINKQKMWVDNGYRKFDFFYMPDFIKIIKYLIDNPGIEKVSCVYKDMVTLDKVADIINDLDEWEVGRTSWEKRLEDYPAKDYIERVRSVLDLDFIGLEQGIKEVYQKLKNED
ncbi:MAG: NAD-dependent epimerase/dehydratase family protein [Romboutsia sp.]|nr:NAD-dependent epimerase/dehydratase family protein [Romboutsia sp.]